MRQQGKGTKPRPPYAHVVKQVYYQVDPWVSIKIWRCYSALKRINQKEIALGISDASWHETYKDSAYIFAGNLAYDLSEGDVITIFSQ
jgi:hypothetical protein